MAKKMINVLAVDDEEFNLDIMQEYFDEAKINSYMAHDGNEALKILQAGHPIDVVILDLMMPVMDGSEFLRKIKENHKYKDIPIIMQTAVINVSEDIAKEVFHCLIKPYSKEQLIDLINIASAQLKPENMR
jgi:putative two-component system response regulator